ncbi:hypothetical protein THAOC_04655 [Thalassiosira oceanica]|uniref:Uncharacterized protein n=1 Tax=Thalassiosira oceanica TaxID=159749 RepID=K0TNQ9_THAOC|nr:hypothetical protein THAOC_04655 [Thalassiosira oceanica]|eukprot:EJK73707.1 hypothetical protein THAOC_04655 [Thalassiosira oceanica]
MSRTATLRWPLALPDPHSPFPTFPARSLWLGTVARLVPASLDGATLLFGRVPPSRCYGAGGRSGPAEGDAEGSAIPLRQTRGGAASESREHGPHRGYTCATGAPGAKSDMSPNLAQSETIGATRSTFCNPERAQCAVPSGASRACQLEGRQSPAQRLLTSREKERSY